MDSEIPLEVLFNVILVKEDVRSATLIQPQDYGEDDQNGTKTSKILNIIINKFGAIMSQSKSDTGPLIFTSKYTPYQGIIVSKTNYYNQKIPLRSMGKILGYPCYKDFNEITPDTDSYYIILYAEYLNKSYELIPNLCLDKSKVSKFKKIAKDAKEALLKHGFDVITKVVVTKKPSHTNTITELLSGGNISKEHIDFINNEFMNNLSSDNSLPEICDYLDYSNKLHRGIVIAFLLNYKNERLRVFYPLSSAQLKLVNEVSNKLQKRTIGLLNDSTLVLNYIKRAENDESLEFIKPFINKSNEIEVGILIGLYINNFYMEMYLSNLPINEEIDEIYSDLKNDTIKILKIKKGESSFGKNILNTKNIQNIQNNKLKEIDILIKQIKRIK